MAARSKADAGQARGKRGWQHVLHAARFSIDGFAAAWHHEDASDRN
jgi:diacylglycerol kinase